MAQKKETGCFPFLTIILFSVIGSGFIKGLLHVSTFTAFITLLLSLSFIFGRSKNREKNTFAWRYLIYSAFVLIVLFGLRYIVSNIPSSDPIIKSDISENIYRERIFENGDSIPVLSQKRQWNDNYGNSFEGHFSVREKDYISSKKEYFNSAQKHKQLSWGGLYQHLAQSDTPKLDLILKKLKKIKESNTLNQFEFADMVVTFIQDIPYSFVFENSCKSADQYEESIRVILESCPDCCIGNIPHGIQNPVGFMGNLKGDCDTRTVIVYAILSYFGYDVAILNSDYYRHSILGLNIPGKGIYKLHNGKRYYIWETTNKYFTLGTLPNNFKNINHWNIVLTNT
ncbi:hypothetical protein [Aquimarina mytili]|uniref:Transglutaminase-like domain-containing protein n=1 Tax=Aquimarina mytili TaxID=874423 RepID=A0A936ZU81_9FLAO|nr:hypothetical protein [Aquimarina mytili]MBL0681998.1 hypothetical protein [Aquimarina mytili]